MKYKNVCLESLAYALPEQVISSAEIESYLGPLYERLSLPVGYLQSVTGIRERRFWERGALPSMKSAETARRALDLARVDPALVGALVHGSVWRDHLEPATACVVHRALGLSQGCMVFDVSNACVGFLTGLLQVANMIELGVIKSGMVVSTESGRDLVESAVEDMRTLRTGSRNEFDLSLASLTVGSASVAAVLTHRSISATGTRLLASVWGADSAAWEYCIIPKDQAGTGRMCPTLTTQSARLIMSGMRLAARTFSELITELAWETADVDRTVGHQVSLPARSLMLRALGLGEERDFSTVEFLGNTVSAAVPLSFAMAIDQRFVTAHDRVVLAGFGSGVNTVMLGLDYQETPSEHCDRCFISPTTHAAKHSSHRRTAEPVELAPERADIVAGLDHGLFG